MIGVEVIQGLVKPEDMPERTEDGNGADGDARVRCSLSSVGPDSEGPGSSEPHPCGGQRNSVRPVKMIITWCGAEPETALTSQATLARG